MVKHPIDQGMTAHAFHHVTFLQDNHFLPSSLFWECRMAGVCSGLIQLCPEKQQLQLHIFPREVGSAKTHLSFEDLAQSMELPPLLLLLLRCLLNLNDLSQEHLVLDFSVYGAC